MEFNNGDKIRIWLEDSVEPEGGFWCYGSIKKVTTIRNNVKSIKLLFVEDGRPFSDCDNDIFVEELNNYKIEKIK